MSPSADVSVAYANLVEMQEDSCRKYASKPLYGIKYGTEYQWVSYQEFGERVNDFRGGLATLGISAGDKVAIISRNTLQWAVAAYATYGLGAQLIPMYETQLARDWKFITEDCGAKILLAANETIFSQVRSFPQQIDLLEHLVLLEGTPDGDIPYYDQLLTLGKASPVDSISPEGKSPMGMIYTSGTTGKPKGVVLSHYNMLFEIASGLPLLGMADEDRTLAFLPWAHIFGQLVEVHGLIQAGAAAGLVEDVNILVEEFPRVQPTIFYAVPRVYNRIYERLSAQIREKPGVIQKLFHGGLLRAKREREGETLGFVDSLVLTLARKIIFRKIQARFGGNMRLAVSAASALSPEVAEFVNDIGIEVYEAYGLSENTGALTTNYPGTRRFGSVGPAIPGVTLKIDRGVEGGNEEDGEIIAYGDNIMLGYHNLPEQTRETVMEDGGLRTGDLGHLDADGYLYITGRVKEQYKMETGKYVSPAPLEEMLKLSAYINQVMIYGLNKPHNVAIIVAEMPAVRVFAEKNGLSGSDSELLENEQVRQLFREQIKEFSREFKSYEWIQNFYLLAEEWNIDNGFLTPTLKLKRTLVEEQYKDTIQDLYS